MIHVEPNLPLLTCAAPVRKSADECMLVCSCEWNKKLPIFLRESSSPLSVDGSAMHED